MANEDEICCRCFLPIHRDDSRDYLGDRIAHKSERCIYLLAAALREAMEDTKRLARAARLVVEIDGDYCACIKVPGELPYRCLTCLLKEEIDAAMKPPGGEGSGHE